MKNLELVKQEKLQLLNSVITEIETREKAIMQAQREKQSLENQSLIIQGALAMLDELIESVEETQLITEDNPEDNK